MLSSQRKCLQPSHNFANIEYVCKYKQCSESRYLCSKCTLESTHWHDLQDNSHIINKKDYDQELLQQIKNAKYIVQKIPNAYDDDFFTGAISNNLKYIVSSGWQPLLNVWDYYSNKRIKSIQFEEFIQFCKFTEDSKLLYVGTFQLLYQIQVNNQFKKIGFMQIHQRSISNIYCLQNNVILTSSCDGTICKSEFINKKQLFRIQAHLFDFEIRGLDYNMRNHVIVSGSEDQSIKLWNGINGSLLIEKENAHNNQYDIIRVLFIVDNDQLISVDLNNYVIVWSIKYKKRKLEIFKTLLGNVFDMTLTLNQQYILVLTYSQYFKLYNNKLEFIRDFYLGDFPLNNMNSVQLNSMKAILFVGRVDDFCQLFVCKIKLD
ncbi:hypothetical protein pb186bvf_014172 [Paramecium bursaria]